MRLPPSALPGISPQGGRSAGGWIVGHFLPAKNGNAVVVWGNRCVHPISPLVGEMPGRCPTRIDR
ncbi:diaminohydroxyphosphoribosylaminopyrimidine deaminase [Rhizobium laguerreae]|nr:diaminohydroxyphosphoribosylaminopyrimidine deaminase [Rhizobium laguerreae]